MSKIENPVEKNHMVENEQASMPDNESADVRHDYKPKRRVISKYERIRSYATPAESPTSYLLRVMRDVRVEPSRRLAAAVAAAPYIGAKCKKEEKEPNPLNFSRLSDDELEVIDRLLKKASVPTQQEPDDLMCAESA
jgi:hypothetical protein